jgi:hypothetical protein
LDTWVSRDQLVCPLTFRCIHDLAGVAALIGRVIKSTAEVASKLGQAKVECICICPAAVMSQ